MDGEAVTEEQGAQVALAAAELLGEVLTAAQELDSAELEQPEQDADGAEDTKGDQEDVVEASVPEVSEVAPAPSSVSHFLEWLKGASTPDVRECRADDSWPPHWTEHDRHAARCALAERITHERGGVVSMPPS